MHKLGKMLTYGENGKNLTRKPQEENLRIFLNKKGFPLKFTQVPIHGPESLMSGLWAQLSSNTKGFTLCVSQAFFSRFLRGSRAENVTALFGALLMTFLHHQIYSNTERELAHWLWVMSRWY